jgi:hypothetical protein
MLLAIDPGTDTGWAVFDGGSLVACGLGTPPDGWPAYCDGFGRVLIEVPKFRRGDPNPQALIVLALKAGEWAGHFCKSSPQYLTPNDWKGSTPKVTSHARILRALSASEHGVMERGTKGLAIGKVHNVMDAIGIGLHGVGRNANGR